MPSSSPRPEWRRQRERWDAVARDMPDLLPAASTGYYARREQALIARYLAPLDGRRVLKLDLWNEAVNTRILSWVRERGAECHGIDVSAVTTGRARGNDPGLHLAQADMRRLPFAGDSFDLAYTMGTIEHVDEYVGALVELRRVLRPGGRAIVGVPNAWDPFLRPLLVRVLERFDLYPFSPEKAFSVAELEAAVTEAGLVPVERAGLLALPGLVRMAELFLMRRGIALHRLSSLVVRPVEWLEERIPALERAGYLLAVVAEKPPTR